MRTTVVGFLPGTAALFSAVGLPVNTVGLRFDAVTSTLTGEGRPPILEIAGTIGNVGPTSREVPPLEIAITGEAGDPLYRWTFRAAEGELKPGATVPFAAKLTSPPPAGRRVAITFAVKAPDRAVALR